jgi:hypothetical protein
MNLNAQDNNNRSRQGRIPATLQAVFLASNRGREVNRPPPAQVASKVYFRNWLFQRQAGSKDKRGSLFAGTKKTKKDRKIKKKDPLEGTVIEVQLEEEQVNVPVKIPTASVSFACLARFICQHCICLTLDSFSTTYFTAPYPYVGPAGVHGRHGSLAGIFHEAVPDASGRLLQQADSTSEGKLQCSHA